MPSPESLRDLAESWRTKSREIDPEGEVNQQWDSESFAYLTCADELDALVKGA